MRPSLYDMLKRDSSENITFRHSVRQWHRTCVHYNLRRLWSLDNGSQRNAMRATSPAIKRRRRTVEADRCKPIAVLQFDSTLWTKMYGPSRPCWQDGRSSRAVVTLRGHFCVRPSSFHWFHARITAIATCPVRAAMSRYDKPASRRLTILPRSNAFTC